jgi:hypothetical protein
VGAAGLVGRREPGRHGRCNSGMKRALVVAIALGGLALAESAIAKGPFTVEICGSSGCTSVRQDSEGGDRGALGNTLLAALDGGRLKAPTVGTPAPAPFLTLRISEWDESPTSYYLPSRRLLRVAPYWFRAPDGFVRRLRAVAAHLEPWPAPTLTRVLVDGRPAVEPARFAVLLSPLPPAPIPTEAGTSVRPRSQPGARHRGRASRSGTSPRPTRSIATRAGCAFRERSPPS